MQLGRQLVGAGTISPRHPRVLYAEELDRPKPLCLGPNTVVEVDLLSQWGMGLEMGRRQLCPTFGLPHKNRFLVAYPSEFSVSAARMARPASSQSPLVYLMEAIKQAARVQ